jgi:crotonobetainyl-CoA:carnitine CoA-transferase CaiB-like acyl-CoA transferase
MCNSTEDVANDAHLERRGFFVDIEHSKAGTVKCPGAPFKMGETPWQIRRPAPLLGQHNGEILGGLGYSDKEIAQLKEEGII